MVKLENVRTKSTARAPLLGCFRPLTAVSDLVGRRGSSDGLPCGLAAAATVPFDLPGQAQVDPSCRQGAKSTIEGSRWLRCEGVAEMTKIIHDRPTDIDTRTPADSQQLARQQTIKQIERGRRFTVSTAVAIVGMALHPQRAQAAHQGSKPGAIGWTLGAPDAMMGAGSSGAMPRVTEGVARGRRGGRSGSCRPWPGCGGPGRCPCDACHSTQRAGAAAARAFVGRAALHRMAEHKARRQLFRRCPPRLHGQSEGS